ncbi:MAG TPA: glycosyltransferase family 4 protein [Vicinamibacterales bacterium]|nr:glycosyltransferase family 4 protein [Vicinamibacterales bacterium]
MAGLRFCLLTTFYPPFNFGGDGIDVHRTARGLVARGHQVTVIHDVDAYEWLAGRRLPRQPIDQDGVEVIGLRSRLGVVSPFLTHQTGYPVVHGRRIQGLIRERRADVVVLNNVSLVGGPGLLSFGDDALRMYVAHEHWLVCPTHVLWRFNREACDERHCTRCMLSYRRPPQPWRYTGALERQLSHVDLFIARSEFSRRKHREFGFTRPMHVLPYFLPGPFPETPPPRASARPQDRPYFLTVGRLTRIKGLDSVIPVFRRFPDADLLIIGDGEEMATLKALAAGAPNVKFLGRVANDQLGPYYEHAVAALMPSLGYETFGIVLIESFRYQTPVIARRIGPFPEIIECANGGLLFSDDQELSSAMTRLLGDAALRDAMAASAYCVTRARWSEDVVIGAYLKLVEDARAGRR